MSLRESAYVDLMVSEKARTWRCHDHKNTWNVTEVLSCTEEAKEREGSSLSRSARVFVCLTCGVCEGLSDVKRAMIGTRRVFGLVHTTYIPCRLVNFYSSLILSVIPATPS
jgi:hypothetical protein